MGPTGKIIGVHRKIHFPADERSFFNPGSSVEVFPTELGNIAIQVCADGTFPELTRAFTLEGAEIICTPYNVPKRAGREYLRERARSIAVCRALENMNFYVACNRVGSDASGGFVGHSCIAGPQGGVLADSQSDEEEILMATLEKETMLEVRAHFTYFGQRRPELYRRLTEPS